VESANGDPRRAELLDARAQLARGLVSERDGEDLVGAERAGGDLVRDPVRDRRRLARPGSRQDADGAYDGLDGTPLLGVELHRSSVRGRIGRDRHGTAPYRPPGWGGSTYHDGRPR
jgi:hypothetical protein